MHNNVSVKNAPSTNRQLSTRGGDRHLRSRYFLYEIQFQTTLIQTFFHIMCIFVSIDPQSESNFPFLYIIRFQTYLIFGAPSFIHGGDRHIRLQTFLYEIQFRTTFILSFLDLIRIFGSVEPYIECTRCDRKVSGLRFEK